MPAFDYTPYIFNPTAEPPTFHKGDAPALVKTENLSDLLSRHLQSKAKENANEDEIIDLRKLPQGWARLASPKGTASSFLEYHFSEGN